MSHGENDTTGFFKLIRVANDLSERIGVEFHHDNARRLAVALTDRRRKPRLIRIAIGCRKRQRRGLLSLFEDGEVGDIRADFGPLRRRKNLPLQVGDHDHAVLRQAFGKFFEPVLELRLRVCLGTSRAR